MLHPYFQERVRAAQQLLDGGASPDEVHLALTATPSTWTVPADVIVAKVEISGQHGPIEARLYRPTGLSAGADHPTVMVMHGGGFQYGDMDMGEAHAVAAELAHRTGAVALTMNYRLVTETVRHPVPLDDVISSWEWLMEHFPRSEKTFIGGGSAGANLAMAATMRLRDEGGRVPDGMLLAYGLFHFPIPGPSIDAQRYLMELPPTMRSNPKDATRIFRLVAGRITDIPKYVAPGNHDLHGMPAAAVLISEYDDLAPSSELLIEQLVDSGIRVVAHLAEAMVHGHLNWFPTEAIPEIETSIAFFADFIQTESASNGG